MVEVHGGANVFQRAGEFPNGTDIEYPVAPAASDFYKNGPSFMQRHLPLWLSVHAQRAIAVLVTAIALGLPMFRFLPWAYNWVTRRRLFYWYAQLKKLEASFDASPVNQHLAEKQAEIERIEEAVSHISTGAGSGRITGMSALCQKRTSARRLQVTSTAFSSLACGGHKFWLENFQKSLGCRHQRSFGKPKDTDATRHCWAQRLHRDRGSIRWGNS
jgi:hypothetical protein